MNRARVAEITAADDGVLQSVSRWKLSAMVTAYLLVGCVLAFRYRTGISPDGTAYIDIARDYASGHLGDAVNGLWSPLYSWILALPVLAGADALLAGQLIQVFVGGVVLIGVHALMSRLRVAPLAALVGSGAMSVVTLSWAVGGVGPDLLPVALGAIYLRLVLGSDRRHWGISLAGGLVAGLGYLAKAAFLPFFMTLTVVVLALSWRRRGTWRPQLVRAGAAVAGFGLLALPWAAAMSVKYDRPTFGTAASYNLAIVGPGFTSVSIAHPQDTAGLLPPPTPRATSVWTDPTAMPLPTWSPLSASGLGHEIRNIGLNIAVTMNFILRFWLLAPIVLLWSLWTSWRRSPSPRDEEIRILTLAVVVQMAIYQPLLVESRYLWLSFALLPVLAAAWWTTSRPKLGTVPAAAALALAAVLLVAQPLHHFLKADSHFTGEALETARALRAMGVAGNVASNVPSAWSDDLYVSYHLGARYYGVVARVDSAARGAQELREHQIDYFLVHGSATPGYLSGFIPIGSIPEESLTVFKSKS